MGRLLKTSDPRARLRQGVERVLRHAVESHRVGRDEHDSVLRSLRSLCRVARSHDVHVEGLVVICKDAWRALPEARELPAEAGTELLKDVISRCIDEFYRTDGIGVGATKLSDSVPVPDSSLSFMFGPLS
jgi:hypothetical protein